MAKKNDANKKHYFRPIENSELVEAMTGYASNPEEVIKIWEQGKSEDTVEEYTITGFIPASLMLTLKSQGGFLSKLTSSKLIDKEVFVKIGEGKFQYFTTSILKKDDEHGYHIFLTNDVFVSQQRSNYRLQANRFNKIQVKIGDGLVKDCHDISAGGTSFTIKGDETAKFFKDAEFKECLLRFNRVDFNIPLMKIAGTWQQKDSEENPIDEYKVGIQFLELSPETEEKLFKHINSEARAEEMRKKMAQMKS